MRSFLNHPLLVSTAAICFAALTSCETGEFSGRSTKKNRYGGDNALPVINTTPTIAVDGTEMFANNPLVEFQTTGSNPAPTRTLYSGQKVTVLSQDGTFSRVQLADGSVGYVNSNSVVNTSYNSGGSAPVQPNYNDGANRFGATDPAPVEPSGITGTPYRPTQPTGPVTTTPDQPSSDPDLIDLDNL